MTGKPITLEFVAGDRVLANAPAYRIGTVHRVTNFGVHVAWDNEYPAHLAGHVYRDGEWVDVCDASGLMHSTESAPRPLDSTTLDDALVQQQEGA